MSQNTDIATIINNSLEVFKGMGDVLKTNVAKADAGINKAKELTAKIPANIEEMTPELDEEIKNFLVNCNKVKGWMEAQRKPGTQLMTAMAKMFTEQERRIDVTVPDTPPFLFQKIRNSYATHLANEEAKRRKAAEEEAAKKTEAIQLKAAVLTQLHTYLNDYLSGKKKRMLDGFNAMTLETIESDTKKFKEFVPKYPESHFNEFTHSIRGKYHSADEVTCMIDNVAEFAEFEERYNSEMQTHCQDLIVKIPSKHQELLEAEERRKEKEAADKSAAEAKSEADKKAAEERAQKLKEEQEEADRKKKLREEQEADELKKKQAADEEAKKLQNNMSANAETVGVLFEAEQAMMPTTEAPESRGGYEILITNPAGWMLIFSFWFEKEGKSLPTAKIEKKTMKQMQTFCESYAHKNNEKIESPYIEYKIVHKAVNRG